MSTIAESRDIVIGIVDAALKADSDTSSVPIHYDNVRSDRPTAGASASSAAEFVVITVRNLSSPQTTQGTRRWMSTGVVTVQIFGKMGDGNQRVDAIAQVVLDGVRAHVGSATGVWFFDQAAAEIGENGAYFQTNVTSFFRYQQKVPA